MEQEMWATTVHMVRSASRLHQSTTAKQSAKAKSTKAAGKLFLTVTQKSTFY